MGRRQKNEGTCISWREVGNLHLVHSRRENKANQGKSVKLCWT